jgi:hypothetical protein
MALFTYVQVALKQQASASDVEKDISEARVLDGFPKVALWSSGPEKTDTGSGIYKLFHKSSTRNLLYLQSRVAALQAKQGEFDQEDYEICVKPLSNRSASLNKNRPAWVDHHFRATPEAIADIRSSIRVLQSAHRSIFPEFVPQSSSGEHQAHSSHPGATRGNGHGDGNESRVGLSDIRTSFTQIHEQLENLEQSCDNPLSKYPRLPQDLFWGPVTDREPYAYSGVPHDFILHRDCNYQRTSPGREFEYRGSSYQVVTNQIPTDECACFRSYRRGKKKFEANPSRRDDLWDHRIIQMFHQRIRMLEDHSLSIQETLEIESGERAEKQALKLLELYGP